MGPPLLATRLTAVSTIKANVSLIVNLSSQPRSAVTAFDDKAEVVTWAKYHAHEVRREETAPATSRLAVFTASCHDARTS